MSDDKRTLRDTGEIIEWVKQHPKYKWDDSVGDRSTEQVYEPSTNKHGNTVTIGFAPDIDGDHCRYFYDFGMCSHTKNWHQYDTDQDASYFGIWVHMRERIIFSYVEGDLTLTECSTVEGFKAELDEMAAFHGDPPPFAKVYDFDEDNPHKLTKVTHCYAKRVSSEDVR